MNLNVIVRGQSNAILAIESNGWSGYGALQGEVQRLLGFDGVIDTVSLVYERYDQSKSTAFGGTALVGDWLTAKNGDWRQGWNNGGEEQSLLNQVNGLAASQKDDPTATLWFHSEYDSANASLTADQWMSAVRFDAAQVRAALGQSAATTPYLFVEAMPYWGTTEGHNAIKQGMERLAADGSFRAEVVARTLDTDVDNDNFDGNEATREYGGPHMDPEDGMQTLLRAARGIAEEFAGYAKPGSAVAKAGGNIADDGPQVIRAELVGTNQLRLDVAHDGASSFKALDADAARGVGWSVTGSGQVNGTAARIVDGDTLLVTFSGNVDPGGTLYYGYGYGRLAGGDGSGRGNAVYDDQGLPIWVSASGLKVGTSAAPANPPAPPVTPPVVQPGGPDRTVNGTSASETLRGTDGRDLMTGGAGNDRMIASGAADTLSGGDGADTMFGGDGADSLSGGAGNDWIRGDAGNDTIATGAGVDAVIVTAGGGADRVTDFVLGTDVMRLTGIATSTVTAAAATVDGVAGLKLTLATGDSLFLDGLGMVTAKQLGLGGTFAGGGGGGTTPPAANVVNGTGGNDWLKGGTGADSLSGGAGSDDLQGLDGADTLRAGTGDDGLTGGAGADVFVQARGDGSDWIADFAPGVDKLRLEGIASGQVTQAVGSAWGIAGLAVNLGSGDAVFLEGVTQKLANTDFVFG